jgi:hypothetical protein
MVDNEKTRRKKAKTNVEQWKMTQEEVIVHIQDE